MEFNNVDKETPLYDSIVLLDNFFYNRVLLFKVYTVFNMTSKCYFDLFQKLRLNREEKHV